MDVADRFLMGEMNQEDALLQDKGPTERWVRILLALAGEEIIMGVRDHGAAPVFTRVPIGLSSGFGVAADRVFHALDARPPWEARGAYHQAFPQFPEAVLAPDVQPALVSALAVLAKEVLIHANR